MIIKRIKLKNIRSYEFQEIEFPSGSILLSGDIGTGKTSALLAIEYALFGLQPGQKGSALLRNDSDIGEVLLEFEIDNRNIIIERRLKRDGNSVSNDYSAITIDGEKSESSVTELKTKILDILRYPPEFIKKNNVLYRYTVYTPQEHMRQIITEDAETRLNILRHTFGIDKYKRIRENIFILLNKLKEDSKLLQGEIKTLDLDKENLNSAIISLNLIKEKIVLQEKEVDNNQNKRKQIESEAKELESKIREKETFEKEVEKTNIMISSKKDNISIFQKELANLTRSLSEISGIFNEQKLKALVNEIGLKKEEIEKLNSRFIELSTIINSLEKNKLESLAKKNRIFSFKICPTCLQDVSETHKHNILNETECNLSEITKNLANLEKEKNDIKPVLSRARNILSNLEEEKAHFETLKAKASLIEKSCKRIDELKKQSDFFDKDISMLTKHLENLKGEIAKFSKFSSLFKTKQDELRTALLIEKQSEIALAEFKKEIELTTRQIELMNEEIARKENSKKKLLAVLELIDWLNSHFLNLVDFTERNVLIRLRLEFSKLFGKWFHMLVAQDFFEIQLDENFTPLIIQGESEMEYSFLSGGERTAIALAYRLALNQTINSILSNIKTKDLVILDEPTDGFSELQLEKMRDVFEELKVAQLLVVSHEQKIESFVDNVIRLKKDGNVSHIDYGLTLSS